jgi:hypothetical protein
VQRGVERGRAELALEATVDERVIDRRRQIVRERAVLGGALDMVDRLAPAHRVHSPCGSARYCVRDPCVWARTPALSAYDHRQKQKALQVGTLKHKKVLGRSALTGTRVLAPASKGASVSVHQVRRALKTLDSHATK